MIGNADGTDSIGPSYERQVGLALTDAQGVVPAGHLDKDLLTLDVTQPFGLRFDIDVVAERVGLSWAGAEPGPRNPGGGLVLVEASDLARALRYRSDGRRRPLRPALDRRPRGDRPARRAAAGRRRPGPGHGPGRGPLQPPRRPRPHGGRPGRAGHRARLPALGLHAALGLPDPRRRGADDARPVGIARPADMEGRPAVSVASGDGLGDRVDRLVSLNDASRFRERLLTPTTTVVVLLLAVCVALGLMAHTSGWSARARRAIAFLALWDLAVLPASYLARAFPLEELGARFYWLVVIVTSLAVAAGAALVAGAHPTAPPGAGDRPRRGGRGARRRRRDRLPPEPQRRLRLLADGQLPALRHQQLLLRPAGRPRPASWRRASPPCGPGRSGRLAGRRPAGRHARGPRRPDLGLRRRRHPRLHAGRPRVRPGAVEAAHPPADAWSWPAPPPSSPSWPSA